jgi:hypothetical protein
MKAVKGRSKDRLFLFAATFVGLLDGFLSARCSTNEVAISNAPIQKKRAFRNKKVGTVLEKGEKEILAQVVPKIIQYIS